MVMTLIGIVVVLAVMLAGFRLGAWATRANGVTLGSKPPPEGWAARCTACGNPVGYQVTWAPAVLAMRKDQRDRVKFDLALTFMQPQRAVVAPPPQPPPPALKLVEAEPPGPETGGAS